MKNLNSKYIKNTLTPSELSQLRETVNEMSDAQLEDVMLDSWLSYNIEESSGGCQERVDKIETKLKNEIWNVRRLTSINKILRIAAILLLPILMLSTFYFYKQSTLVSSNDMVIETGKGERASLVLPDGTKVTLNSESALRYNPKSFNKKERNISFNGEAFFKVFSNKEAPFIISTGEMNLQVLGTKFNLLSRAQLPVIEVSLLEGHVLLSSQISSKTQELFCSQKAIFNKSTGEFTVIKEKDIRSGIGWLNGNLVFSNLPLQDVLKAIETSYGVTFVLKDCANMAKDPFTGTLSNRNLNEVLDILQKSYGFKYSQLGNEITISFK